MTSNNLFASFLETSSSNNSQNTVGNVPRLAPSPMAGPQQGPNNANGNNGAAMNGLPMAAGTQMDVNFLYQKVIELSEVLRDNREKTQSIVGAAEELAVRHASCSDHKKVYHEPHSLTESRLVLPLVEPALHFRKPMPSFQVFLLPARSRFNSLSLYPSCAYIRP